jgi:predicted lipoprotein with Yx(FWY)xxD motif
MEVRIPRGNSNRYHVQLIVVALLTLFGLVVTGTAGAHQTARSATVKTRKISGLGVVLVNAKGRTLYVFMKDARRHVTCTGSCAVYWPPLKWKGTGKPKAGGSARAKLLGLDKNPAGGKVVTYSKWPLYTYAGDSRTGQAKGEGLNQNGGKWYVISPKGKLIKHRH